MKKVENIKEVWVKPEVKSLSVKKETMSGMSGNTENNGQTNKKMAS